MTRVAMPSVDSVDSVNHGEIIYVNTAADHGPGPGPRDIQMSPAVVPGHCWSWGLTAPGSSCSPASLASVIR